MSLISAGSISLDSTFKAERLSTEGGEGGGGGRGVSSRNIENNTNSLQYYIVIRDLLRMPVLHQDNHQNRIQ
jgi:hypothetical protein